MDNEEKIVPNYALDIINSNHALEKKRLWILVFVLLALLLGTNTSWIIYESQYEDIVTTVSQDAVSDSGDAIVNGTYAGAVVNERESETNSNN